MVFREAIVLYFLFVLIVHQTVSKPQLCAEAPKWTVDEYGRTTPLGKYSPMKDSRGNVVLVAFLKASRQFCQQQASKLGAMLRFLRSTGLTDVRIFVVNSRQMSSYHSLQAILHNVESSGITVFQETGEEPVWEMLEAGNNDMFIYDRCGRLTYYVPHPLSSIHPRHPIIQAAILSTYFDNPCGNTCEYRLQEHAFDRRPTEPPVDATLTPVEDIVNVSSSTPSLITVGPVSMNVSQVEGKTTKGPKAAKFNETLVAELKAEELIPVLPTEGYGEPVEDDSVDGSGSGEAYDNGLRGVTVRIANMTEATTLQFMNASGTPENVTEEVTTAPILVTTSSYERSTPSAAVTLAGPWRIFNFFLRQRNTTRRTTTTASPVKNDTELSTAKPTPSPVKLYCLHLNKSICAQFSSDRLLRARLCCLKEDIGIDGESLSFGCQKYTKPLCTKMIPLIKCCLKDISEMLNEYFESRIPNGRPKVHNGG